MGMDLGSSADQCWMGRWWVDSVLFMMIEVVCDAFGVVLGDGLESRFAVGIWKGGMIAFHYSTRNTEAGKGCWFSVILSFPSKILTIHCPLTTLFKLTLGVRNELHYLNLILQRMFSLLPKCCQIKILTSRSRYNAMEKELEDINAIIAACEEQVGSTSDP